MMAIIFLLSATPSEQLPDAGAFDLLLKKGGHFVGYGILALSYLRIVRLPDNGKKLVLSFALTLLYALSDEIHQAFVPGRHSSPADIGIDLLGSAIFIYFYAISMKLRSLVHFSD